MGEDRIGQDRIGETIIGEESMCEWLQLSTTHRDHSFVNRPCLIVIVSSIY